MNFSGLTHQLSHVPRKFSFVGKHVRISFSASALIERINGTWSQCGYFSRMFAYSCRQAVPALWGRGLAEEWWLCFPHTVYNTETVELAVMRKLMCQGKIVSMLCFARWWRWLVSPVIVTQLLGAKYLVTKAFALFLSVCWSLQSKSRHSFKTETYGLKLILKKHAAFHEDGY